MNTDQFRLLEEHNLTPDMIFALANLVAGKKHRHQNRSFKAIHRRGLATENFEATENGASLYENYCSLGQTIEEYQAEINEKVRQQIEKEKVEDERFANTLSEFGARDSTVDVHDMELRTVIQLWPTLPWEFRTLIADAVKRMAKP